jgi:hypothetical protein
MYMSSGLNSVQCLYEMEFSLTKNLIAGSTQATRFTAARQIGDIAKSHPQDLTSLLKKVFYCSLFFRLAEMLIIIFI